MRGHTMAETAVKVVPATFEKVAETKARLEIGARGE